MTYEEEIVRQIFDKTTVAKVEQQFIDKIAVSSPEFRPRELEKLL
jgi:hypothetical protein